MTPRYIATIVLREQGKPDVLATKTAVLYSDQLRESECMLRMKSLEILRDVQWIASDGKIPKTELYGRPFFWGVGSE